MTHSKRIKPLVPQIIDVSFIVAIEYLRISKIPNQWLAFWHYETEVSLLQHISPVRELSPFNQN